LNLGELALRLLSYDDAQTRFAEALPLYRQVADPRGEANCLKNLAFTAFSRNDRDAAKSFFRDALEIYQEISELYSVGMTHQALAQLASEVDDRNSHWA
jgi:tetratricopeptide (TPR) repeat protein